MHQDRIYLHLKKETGGCVAAASLFSEEITWIGVQAVGEAGDHLFSSSER
jgi:hypothetical protein